MKKWIAPIIGSIFIGMLALFLIDKTRGVTATTIVINEVCSRNATLALEEEFLGDDYIELYNTTDKAINLSGWWLSDDGEDLKKHCLPEVVIEPDDYVVFYANGKDGMYSLNFKVSLEGEEIFLSSPEGEVVDQTFVPKLAMDTVYARTRDAGSEWAVMEPSPKCKNSEAALAKNVVLDVPVFSHKGGFYKEEFVLKITSKRNENIYYTLDGSNPTTNSDRYEDGIKISNRSGEKNILNSTKKLVLDWNDYIPSKEKVDKATVVRAIAVDKKGNVSEIVTETYFVDLEHFKEKTVLSIVAEPEKLLGENGIFVTGSEYDKWYITDQLSKDGTYEEHRTANYELANFFQHGRTYEVLSEVQFFENGTKSFEQFAGLKVQGNATRVHPKKNLQLVSRSVYSDDSIFKKDIFEGTKSHAFYVSANPEKAYFIKLAEERNLGTQSTKECAVFINGEYWYTSVLMEKYDETYFLEHYGVTEDNVLMIKDTEATVGSKNQWIYDELVEYLRDETIPKEEKGLYLYEVVDVQSFIDWMCLNLYLGNDDVSYKKNCVLWRTLERETGVYGDCRWRWNVYDIDHAAVGANPESVDFQEFSIVSGNRFYWGLRTVPHFRQQFVLTAMDMMNTNLKAENVEPILEEWGLDLSYSNGYFLKRPEYMIESLRNEFDLIGTVENIYLDSNDAEAGKIYINTICAEISEESWCGQYFTDYPVTVTAVANPGYRFVGWSGDVESVESSIHMNLEQGGNTLIAVFEEE